jgi:hypothetical protein
MKAWQPIFRLARNSLVVLGTVVLLSVAVVVGLQYWATGVNAALTQLQASAQTQQELLTTKHEDLLNMRGHIKRFEVLRSQGMLGSPDRAQWVEQLQASYAAIGFGGRIAYQLQAPQPLVNATAQASAGDGEGIQPQFHDLKMELRQAHEADLINLIANYRTTVKGRFRVQSCALDNAKEDGLNANCVLRFVSVPLPLPAPPPDSTTATPNP